MLRRRRLVLIAATCALAIPLLVSVARAEVSAAPVIAYPNLRVEVPVGDIAISSPSAGVRDLDFTHITWNAGPGPLEIDPQYNPTTGTAQANQALYTLTGPSTWSYVSSVPIVKPMVWDPPADYRFPLTGFGLYTVGSGGGVGTLVASSPKVDFCMTPDTYVGGVPDTAPSASPPESDCTNPNGTLGLSVGWGDEYDYTDAGNNIDISNLANGTYWLQAQADPGNYFQQAGPDDTITDTELSITGSSVTVLQQVNPGISPPVVTITSPGAGSVSTPLTVNATVSDTSPVTSVQFLLDGLPLGSPVTQSPYSVAVQTLPSGSHLLSAQAVDANGLTGTAPAVAITVPTTVGGLTIDKQVNVTGTTTVTTPSLSTSGPNELLLALVGSDANPASAHSQTVTVSGGGLTWSLVTRARVADGDSEIWSATAPSTLSGATFTSTASQKGYQQSLTVLALAGAEGIGNSAATGATSGAPSVSLTTTAAGSIVFGVGNDYDNAIGRTVGTGQALLSQWVDNATGDTYWSQYTTTPSSGPGQSLSVFDTAPTGDQWNLAAVEVTPAGSSSLAPPTVALSAPAPNATVTGTTPVTATATPANGASIAQVQLLLDGQPLGPALTAAPYTWSWDSTGVTNATHTLGAVATQSNGAVGYAPTITITVSNAAPPAVVTITQPTAGQSLSGTVSVTATVDIPAPVANVQFFLDGLALGAAVTSAPYTVSWNTTTALNGSHTLSAQATDVNGNVTKSAPVTVTVSNASTCFTVDVNTVAHGKGPVTSAAFHTASSSELLLALVGSDGPDVAGKQTVTVSGAGLTWKLVTRADKSGGDAEIWEAVATAKLTNAQVTATQSSKGYDEYLDVVSIQGTSGVGASAQASANSGAPTVTLTTTEPQSLVFGVGNDYNKAVARTPGANQVLLGQWLDTGTGDTYWSQNTALQSGAAGSAVTLNDTSPTTDPWNLAAVEVLAASNAAYTSS